MIEMPFEKEIKKENKVFHGYTFRQIIALIIAFAIGLIIYKIAGISLDDSWFIFLAVAVVAYGIGWFNKNGLYLEKIGKKRLNTFIYRNQRRNYRSLNQYISLYNKEYAKIRNQDMQDKKKQKEKKKALEKKRKKIHTKGYA